MTEARAGDIGAALFSELLIADQMARARLSRVLPKGMELSHFGVLNLLAHAQEERTPAQLARAFHVTRGAMSNTLAKLEWAGYIHVRPDWDDARRKFVSLSPAGRQARDAALATLTPLMSEMVATLGPERARQVIPALRALRQVLEGSQSAIRPERSEDRQDCARNRRAIRPERSEDR